MSLREALDGQDYPCDYPFKLICQPDAVETVRRAILDSLGTSTPIHDVQQRASRSGRYVALTVRAQVASADQVEQVYQDLGGVSGIVTSL